MAELHALRQQVGSLLRECAENALAYIDGKPIRVLTSV